jgi:hypothetical protein
MMILYDVNKDNDDVRQRSFQSLRFDFLVGAWMAGQTDESFLFGQTARLMIGKKPSRKSSRIEGGP